MAVAFADFRFAVCLVREGAGLQLAGPRAEAHRAAHFVHAEQFAQFVNHAMGRLLVEFRAVCVGDFCDVPCVFNRGALHAEADSKERNFVFARVLNGVNHSLNSTLTEAARHKNAVVTVQAFRGDLRRFNFLGLNPINHRFVIVRKTAVEQRFAQTLIRIFELYILSDNRDARFARRMMHALNEIDPRLQVLRTIFEMQQT